VDPLHLPFNKIPPPVHIAQVIADDKQFAARNGMQLPPHYFSFNQQDALAAQILLPLFGQCRLKVIRTLHEQQENQAIRRSVVLARRLLL
jgi:hypothetical protein